MRHFEMWKQPNGELCIKWNYFKCLNNRMFKLQNKCQTTLPYDTHCVLHNTLILGPLTAMILGIDLQFVPGVWLLAHIPTLTLQYNNDDDADDQYDDNDDNNNNNDDDDDYDDDGISVSGLLLA